MRVNILLYRGELDHPEITGHKLIRKMKARPEATEFLVEIAEPTKIVTGGKEGRE